MRRKKLIRISTVPGSLNSFCRGQLSELSKQYEVIALSSSGESLSELGKREGVRTIAVDMQRHISLIKDLKSLVKLTKAFRSERPTIIHSMTPKAGMLSMVAAWFTRVPIRIHTFTGLVFPTAKGLKRRILMTTDWITCACATHIIPEGEGVKNDLLNYKITRKPLQVLGHGNVRGIDLTHYSLTPEVVEKANCIRKGKENEVWFIFVGRIVHDKGIDELATAFRQLHEQILGIRLILVGDYEDNLDPIMPENQKFLESCPAVTLAGRQSDVRPWLAASDIFVLPSHREGFPNSVIEAGAMGLPSIVTDINGSREIIIEGENGTIVIPQLVEPLRKAMQRLACDTDLRSVLAAKARPLVATRYEQSYVLRCLMDFYDKVLNDKK